MKNEERDDGSEGRGGKRITCESVFLCLRVFNPSTPRKPNPNTPYFLVHFLWVLTKEREREKEKHLVLYLLPSSSSTVIFPYILSRKTKPKSTCFPSHASLDSFSKFYLFKIPF